MSPSRPSPGGDSRVPQGQVGLHPSLLRVVQRHLATEDRAPIPEHTRQAHARLAQVLQTDPDRPLILDSGCGRGDSTQQLSKRHPEAWVVGVDQSRVRLSKGPFGAMRSRDPLNRLDHAVVVRADVPSLWRLLLAEGRRLEAHYILYPNPWPKKRHLMRRWHGHPAFANLLRLGGRLVLRTNWSVYIEEMAAALEIAARQVELRSEIALGPAPSPPLSHFERKYADSGHPLWQIQVDL